MIYGMHNSKKKNLYNINWYLTNQNYKYNYIIKLKLNIYYTIKFIK
jgi:hypothetical protein